MEENKASELKELAVIEKALMEPSEADTNNVIALLEGHYKGLVFDVSTTAGLDDARSNRRKLVTFKTSGDKKRLELNRPEMEKINQRNTQWKRLESVLEDLKAPINKTIKDRDAEIEAEREKKCEIERARVAAIQSRIDVFRNAPAQAVGRTSEQIGFAFTKISAMPVLDGSYQELLGEAEAAKKQCLVSLEELREKIASDEAEAARIEAERVERERLEAEERERVRLAQEAEAARLEALRIEQEKAAAIERERLAAEKAESDRVAAEQAEQLRHEREIFEVECARQKLIDDAARVAREAEEKRIADEQAVRQAEIYRQAAKLKRQQDAMAETLRLAEQAEKDRVAAEEQVKIDLARAVEQAQQQVECSPDFDYDIILRKSSAGWLGIKDDYRTGKHYATAVAALKQVEKFIAEGKHERGPK